MKKGQAKTVIQRHHASYNPEIIFRVTRTEHFMLTRISRMKKPYTRGFIDSLRVLVALYGPEAEEK